MVYVGMNMHKKTTTYCAINEDDKVIRRSTQIYHRGLPAFLF